MKTYKQIFFVLCLFTNSLQAASTIVSLAEGREKLKVPQYTLAEKERLADQAAFLLRELYVHRDLKVEHFGAAIDPLPRLEALKKEAAELSSEVFHEKISQIFLDLRDLHTNYYAPAPLSCGTAFIPLRFQSVKVGNREAIVVAQKLKTKSELTENIAIGDELLEVDGNRVESAVKGLSVFAAGANQDALRLRAIQMLSMRSARTQPLPKENIVTFSFQGPTGSYTKEIPWQAVLNDDCLLGLNRGPQIRTISQFNLAEDDYQKTFNRIFGNPSLPGRRMNRPLNPALSEVFDAALLTTPAGPLGYLRLKSFYWSSRGLDQTTVINGIRQVVEEDFSSAKGLVIDVRGNPGGLITLSEELVQLFSRKVVQPTLVRLLANSLNEQIFINANGHDNRWSQAVQKAMAGASRYAGPLAITPQREANAIGQVWFKPTVVLTDASCYSACDIFTAGMKDNTAAKIIGVHQTTGGGGANVMEYNTFRSILSGSDKNPFSLLPYQQNMRVSWRQSVRVAAGLGKLIEDTGVESDAVVPLAIEDINGESKALMKKLHEFIDQLLPDYQSSIKFRPSGLVSMANAKPAQWIETVQGVDAIEVIAQGKKVAEFTIPDPQVTAPVDIVTPKLIGEWRDLPVTLLGKSKGLPKFRVVREIQWRGEYETIPEAGLKADFSQGQLGPVRTVVLHGGNDSGWQVVNERLRVGKGPKYEGSTHSRAFIPVKIESHTSSFTFDISMSAEDPFDSLRLYLMNPDTGEKVHLFAGSNIRPLTGVEVPMPTGWQRADIVFEFESDENWNMTGPELDNFLIQFKN